MEGELRACLEICSRLLILSALPVPRHLIEQYERNLIQDLLVCTAGISKFGISIESYDTNVYDISLM